MTAGPSIDPDPLPDRAAGAGQPVPDDGLLTTFVNALLSAQADAVSGAGGEKHPRHHRRRHHRRRYRRGHPLGEPVARAAATNSSISALINYENTTAPNREAIWRSPPRFGGNHKPNSSATLAFTMARAARTAGGHSGPRPGC